MDIGMMNDVARLKKTFVFSPTKKRFNYFQFIFMTTIINTISLQNKFFTKKIITKQTPGIQIFNTTNHPKYLHTMLLC